MKVPVPAADGVNTPDEETPGPDHVPPAVAAVKVTAPSVIQKSAG